MAECFAQCTRIVAGCGASFACSDTRVRLPYAHVHHYVWAMGDHLPHQFRACSVFDPNELGAS